MSQAFSSTTTTTGPLTVNTYTFDGEVAERFDDRVTITAARESVALHFMDDTAHVQHAGVGRGYATVHFATADGSTVELFAPSVDALVSLLSEARHALLAAEKVSA